MSRNCWSELRGSLYSYLQSNNSDEVYKLANFVINGVLISDKIVLELNSLFPNDSRHSKGRVLGEVAEEELTLIKDELSLIISRVEDFSFMEIVKGGVTFRFNFLFEEENTESAFRVLVLAIDSNPKTLLLFTGNKGKILRVSRVFESEENIEALNSLVNYFAKGL
jgi:hypothetical protein